MFFDTEFLKNEEIQLILEKTVETDPVKNWLPAYHFDICDLAGTKMGACDLRIGHNARVYYGGSIGYRVEEPHRGHHYAGKACRLLFQLAKRHGMGYVIITCNPDNWASRRTCEYAGGKLVEIVELRDHPWFVGVQFHPEFKSRPDRPHPLFYGFVKASAERD